MNALVAGIVSDLLTVLEGALRVAMAVAFVAAVVFLAIGVTSLVALELQRRREIRSHQARRVR